LGILNQFFNFINNTIMKELSIEKMEMVNGGSLPGCVGAVFGVVGIVAGIALIPTGPLGWTAAGWLYTGGVAAGISTGLSIGDCIFN
jgi:hypothetical protein